jgi:hypothetical protein
MKRTLFLAALAGVLALALSGCDYGYADGEDPALLDEGTGTLEYGLRADDEAASESGLYEQPSLPASGSSPSYTIYVQSSGSAPVTGLPVQHPDPKPWKK